MNEPTRYSGQVARGRAVAAMATGVVVAMLAGCQHTVKIEPIRVEPIHLTLDVTLKVDRELDRFFDFQDPGAAGPSSTPREGDPS